MEGDETTGELAIMERGAAKEAPLSGDASDSKSDDAEMMPLMKRTPQESALSNDIILHCIFEQLIQGEGSDCNMLANVRNVRLVSEKWRDVMTKLFRRIRSPTHFTSCYSWGNNPGEPFNFLRVMSKSRLVPVQHYHFHETFFHGSGSFHIFSRLLRAVGSSMVTLQLEVAPHQLKLHVVKNLLKVKLDNLQTLHVDMLHHSPERHTHVSPIGLLLNAAPHLREFQLSYCPMNESVGEDELGTNYLKDRTLEMVCKRLPKSVKSLGIFDLLLGERAANLLLRTGPRLHHLRIALHPKPMSSVETLLASQELTLSSLHVHGLSTEHRDGELLHFPLLRELTSLTFEGLGCAPFSTAQIFPKLKTLDTYGMDVELFSSLLKQAPVATSVKELQLPYHFTEYPQLVRPLSTHFPSISNLCLELGSVYTEGQDTIRNIFTHLTNIECLSLCLDTEGGGHASLNLDSLFSGIEESICKQLRWGGRVDASTTRELVTRPSLLSLTRLKRLRVECRRLEMSNRLIMTNLAADVVFLSMPSLRELSIPNTMFTERCIRLMQEKFDRFSFQDDFSTWDGDDYSGEEEV